MKLESYPDKMSRRRIEKAARIIGVSLTRMNRIINDDNNLDKSQKKITTRRDRGNRICTAGDCGDKTSVSSYYYCPYHETKAKELDVGPDEEYSIVLPTNSSH
jgi:hypothetical protein